jgi:UDP-3-O-[3-hydroxymyristoyl] glucosamine N-acyltransferase
MISQILQKFKLNELNSFTNSNLSKVGISLKLVGDKLQPGDVTFIDDLRYKNLLPSDITNCAVLTTLEIFQLIHHEFSLLKFIIVNDPRFSFYALHNEINTLINEYDFESQISSSAKVSPSAYISPRGVRIGSQTVVDEFVSIQAGTTIGQNCVIQSGCRLGDSGFEFKRTKYGIVSVFHDGGLDIGDEVYIGANSTIARGFLGKDTKLGKQTKIDFGVSIAHRTQIGERVFVAAGTVISGSVLVGDDTWIGPSVVVSNGIEIGRSSHIVLGSIVLKGMKENSWYMSVPERNILRSKDSI